MTEISAALFRTTLVLFLPLLLTKEKPKSSPDILRGWAETRRVLVSLRHLHWHSCTFIPQRKGRWGWVGRWEGWGGAETTTSVCNRRGNCVGSENEVVCECLNKNTLLMISPHKETCQCVSHSDLQMNVTSTRTLPSTPAGTHQVSPSSVGQHIQPHRPREWTYLDFPLCQSNLTRDIIYIILLYIILCMSLYWSIEQQNSLLSDHKEILTHLQSDHGKKNKKNTHNFLLCHSRVFISLIPVCLKFNPQWFSLQRVIKPARKRTTHYSMMSH